MSRRLVAGGTLGKGAALARLIEFVEQAQLSAWDDLGWALRRAIGSSPWSIEVEGIAETIRDAAELVGPTPLGEVPWEIYIGGLYDEIVKGLPVPEVDEATMARYREVMAPRYDRHLYGLAAAATAHVPAWLARRAVS